MQNQFRCNSKHGTEEDSVDATKVGATLNVLNVCISHQEK